MTNVDHANPKRTTKKTKTTSKKTTSWRSILIAGGADVGRIDYHTGGAGTAGRGGWHTGEDIGRKGGGTFGAGIRTPLSGKVVSAGWGAGGGSAFGKAVLVRLDNGDYIFFAHLSQINVKVGQRLSAGAWIGRAGSTGNSSGPHLHLEIRRASSGGHWSRTDSTFYNPVKYLDRVTKGLSYDPKAGGEKGSNPDAPPPKGGADSHTSSSTSTHSGSGSGVGKVAFSKEEFYADLESMFGDLATLLALDKAAVKENGGKSIQWAIDQAVKQKITDSDRFLTLLNKTAWFKKYGVETTKRLVEEKSKPQLFGSQRDQVKASIAQYASNLGVTLNDAVLTKLARDAYVFQWDSSSAQVLDRIQASAMGGQGTFAGGTIGEAAEKLDEYAREFGVQVGTSDLKQLRNDIFDGLGDQRMKDLLQARSAQIYSVFADEIKKGVSVRTLADPYIKQAADLLEMSPDEVDFNDPLFTAGKAFQTTDPNTGKIVQRTLADFQKMVRSDSRWGTTVNARQTSMEMAAGILHQMGLF